MDSETGAFLLRPITVAMASLPIITLPFTQLALSCVLIVGICFWAQGEVCCGAWCEVFLWSWERSLLSLKVILESKNWIAEKLM